jgi:hypothetical protein
MLREKEHLGYTRRRLEDNMKIDLHELEFWVVYWIKVDGDRDSWR